MADHPAGPPANAAGVLGEEQPGPGRGRRVTVSVNGGTRFMDALRDPGLRRFSSGTLAWGTGHQMITVAQGFVLFDMTGSTLWLAWLGAAVGVPNFLLALVGGVLSDRYPRKLLLMTGATITGVPAAAIAILYATGSLQPWHILIAGSAQGASLALDWTSRLSLIPSIVPRRVLVSAISLDQSVFNLARVAGPLIAGGALASLGPSAAYGAAAGLLAAAFLIYATFKPVGARLRRAHTPVLAGLSETFRLLRSNRIIGLNVVFTSVNAMLLGGFVFLLPAFAREIIGTGELGLGLLFAATGTGAFLGALLVAWKGGTIPAGRALLISNLLFAGSAVAFSQSDRLWQGALAAFAFGAFNAIHVSLGVSAIQVNVAEHIRGRVIGAYELAWSSFPLGGLIVGAIAAGVGLSWSIVTAAAAVALFTAAVFVFSPSVRNLRL